MMKIIGSILVLLCFCSCGSFVHMKTIQGDLVLEKQTSFMMACRDNSLTRVKNFIEDGEDVNKKTDRLMTALHYAAANGHVEIVRILIENGADVNAMDDALLFSPLHLSASFGHMDVVELLVENKADVNISDYRARTPMYYAAATHNKNLVTYFIRQGARINPPDTNAKKCYQRMDDLSIYATCQFLKAQFYEETNRIGAAKDLYQEAANYSDEAEDEYKKTVRLIKTKAVVDILLLASLYAAADVNLMAQERYGLTPEVYLDPYSNRYSASYKMNTMYLQNAAKIEKSTEELKARCLRSIESCKELKEESKKRISNLKR